MPNTITTLRKEENTSSLPCNTTSIDLFDDFLPKITKICIYCQLPKLLAEFPLHSHSKDGLDSRCVECVRKQSALRKRLRKTAPDKPVTCECCGQPPKKWCLDHDHKQEIFRGWLCDNCNTAIGALGDTHEGVLKALYYIMVHERKNGTISDDAFSTLQLLQQKLQ